MFFKNIEKCVAVVTGAGAGIGRALAIQLAKQDVDLALADVDSNALEGTKALLEEYDVDVSLHSVNVSDWEAMQVFADDVIAEHGQVNLLFNIAGITVVKSFEDATVGDWERITGVNYWGVIYGCKAFIPHMKEQPRSHIANMSSMAAFAGLPEQSSYCATKAAVRALSESLFVELKPYNIGVTSIHPGMVKTDFIENSADSKTDNKVAEMSAKLMQSVGMDVDKTAARIIKAVKKNELHLVLGADSMMINWAKRYAPYLFHQALPLANRFM